MKVITVNADTGERVYSRKEVATLCGVTTQTIRKWEDEKAIPPSVRDENDYRYWYEKDLDSIKTYAKIPRRGKYKRK